MSICYDFEFLPFSKCFLFSYVWGQCVCGTCVCVCVSVIYVCCSISVYVAYVCVVCVYMCYTCVCGLCVYGICVCVLYVSVWFTCVRDICTSVCLHVCALLYHSALFPSLREPGPGLAASKSCWSYDPLCSILHPSAGVISVSTPTFYTHAGDLNSGPLLSQQVLLPTKPSSQSCMFIIF